MIFILAISLLYLFVAIYMGASDFLPFPILMLSLIILMSVIDIFYRRCPKCKVFRVFERSGASIRVADNPNKYNQLWKCRRCQHSEWREYTPSSGGGSGGGGGFGGGGGGC